MFSNPESKGLGLGLRTEQFTHKRVKVDLSLQQEHTFFSSPYNVSGICM